MDPWCTLLLAGLAASVAAVPSPAPEGSPIRVEQLRPAAPRPLLPIPALPFPEAGDPLRPAQLAEAGPPELRSGTEQLSARRDLCEQIRAGERPAIEGLDCAPPPLPAAVRGPSASPAPGRTRDPGAGAGVPVPGGPQRGVVLLDPE